MRIAQIATLAGRVRPDHGQSVETVVWLLTRELTRLGHEVTVFGAAGSEPDGELVATLPGPCAKDGSPDNWQLCELINLCRAVEESGRFDVLHSHAYLLGLPLQPFFQAPVVHTTHVCPGPDEAYLWTRTPEACVTAISKFQWSQFPHLRPHSVIYHGVDAAQFSLCLEPEDYVCFLGRFVPGKGPSAAIAAARDLGLRLLLAGPPNDYFRAHIERLVDGRMVQYIGPVSGKKRDQLLGRARALLYPLSIPEPFGLVPVEAMMCGTPVAATGIGAVPEIVEEGITGCCAPSEDNFPSAVLKALALDRRSIRARAEARFSPQKMARDYESLYERLVARR